MLQRLTTFRLFTPAYRPNQALTQFLTEVDHKWPTVNGLMNIYPVDSKAKLEALTIIYRIGSGITDNVFSTASVSGLDYLSVCWTRFAMPESVAYRFLCAMDLSPDLSTRWLDYAFFQLQAPIFFAAFVHQKELEPWTAEEEEEDVDSMGDEVDDFVSQAPVWGPIVFPLVAKMLAGGDEGAINLFERLSFKAVSYYVSEQSCCSWVSLKYMDAVHKFKSRYELDNRIEAILRSLVVYPNHLLVVAVEILRVGKGLSGQLDVFEGESEDHPSEFGMATEDGGGSSVDTEYEDNIRQEWCSLYIHGQELLSREYKIPFGEDGTWIHQGPYVPMLCYMHTASLLRKNHYTEESKFTNPPNLATLASVDFVLFDPNVEPSVNWAVVLGNYKRTVSAFRPSLALEVSIGLDDPYSRNLHRAWPEADESLLQ